MKKLLLLISIFALTGAYAQEILLVDLSVDNQVTITAAAGTSLADASGSDTTGFYFENFFTMDQTLTSTLVSGTLTSTPDPSDGSPSLYRSGSTDPGLNIWSYVDGSTSTFTLGQQAFTGEGTWTVSPEVYAVMLNAPALGNVYFPADDVSDLGSATLIGTYIVTTDVLGVDDLQSSNNLTYYPNPMKDVLNITSQKIIEQVTIHNILGKQVSVQRINGVDGTLNTTSLAQGAYFFTAAFDDGTSQSFKLLKK